jgi:hypothetical protein
MVIVKTERKTFVELFSAVTITESALVPPLRGTISDAFRCKDQPDI